MSKLISVTDLLAIYGAIAATASGAWQVFQHYNRGPDLRCRYTPSTVTAAYGQIGTEKHLVLNVQNRGTETTTITNVGLITFKSTLHRLVGKVLNHYVVLPGTIGQQLPFTIAVGGTFMATMNQTEEFEKMTRTDLVFIQVFHSFAEKPVLLRIRPIAVSAPVSSAN